MKPVKINLQKGSVFIIFWDSRNEGGNSIAYLSETLLSGLGAMLFSQFFFFFFCHCCCSLAHRTPQTISQAIFFMVCGIPNPVEQ